MIDIGKIGNSQPYKIFVDHYLNTLDDNHKIIEAFLTFF